MIRFSISMAGCHACNMRCLYCSADTDSSKTLKADWAALKHTIENCPSEKAKIEKLKKEGKDIPILFDIWGGNPLFHFEAFKETVNNLKLMFPAARFRTSDNGLSFKDDEKLQFCIDNGIRLQLSHDGLGQWIRSGNFDPLYDPETSDAIVQMAKNGYLDSINCCMNRYNCSPIKNIKYFNKWRFENGLLAQNIEIRLNHPWAGSDLVQKKNEKGRWQDTIREDLIGKELGSLEFSGEELNTFIHEMRLLGLMVRNERFNDCADLNPYRRYIFDQTMRYTKYKSELSRTSNLCRDYQLGLVDYSFTIDTLGRYCDCNLNDGDQFVKNPTCVMPDYCKDCKYKLVTSCLRCGAEFLPEKCEFQKEFARLQEEFFLIDKKETLFNTFE